MRTQPVVGPPVWTASQLQADPSWTYTLDAPQRAECLAALEHTRVRGLALDRIDPDEFPLPTLGPVLDGVIEQIEGGRGVTLLRGIPIEGLSLPDIESLFWGLASHMGYPEPQDASGQRLHHVRAAHVFIDETSARAAFQGGTLRGYQTNVELDFHGDGSDALFILCVQNAMSGGLSRVVSVGQAFNTLLASEPELAMVLQQDFHFDARGELGPDRPFQTAPILTDHAGRLNILYKRGYIELAQQMDGVVPLTPVQRRALDALDAALNDPDHVHTFRMQPGDIQIASNHAVLHARTTFEEWPEPERKRHMLRIWSTLRRNRRPLPPAYRTTREFAASHVRRLALGDPG
ncbi:MAG: TauD/TfdA family dioxygenase [Brevundimonas sp.]|uniref:TauD/TfdA family dioxygenase n=1 Tax=Brevundimonas sp. TaxID=1871086 RepID=UPI002735EE92|nr:TauD/TfdA family dioxygenase [Brevundimonas sp.]MDP3379891.1 TauD/TfdA family dioxygenase [Brevundimonas sp.]